jgi:hypothetical protein
MGDLDGKVKHILKPMILGESRVLSPQEQLTIATWAAMKTMVLEYVWGADQPVVSPQEDRSFMFKEQRPPDSMQIRIAAVESNGQPALATRRVYLTRVQPGVRSEPPKFAFCVTFVLGCFVVQTFGEPVAIPGSSQRIAKALTNFIPIYPATGDSISWPPPEVLDDASLQKFAHPLQPVMGG